MVWIQIRTDALSFLIWVRNLKFTKGNQQTTKVTLSKEKVKYPKHIFDWKVLNIL